MNPSDHTSPSPPSQSDALGNPLRHTAAGTFIPLSNTDFSTYLQALKTHKLTYSIQNFPYFDGEIAKYYPNAALTDPNNITYAQYQPLRKNIAVLRNFILSHLLQNADANLEETANNYVRTIANTIGEALKRGSNVLRNPFEPALTIKETNVLGHGGTTIYQLLLQLQINIPQQKSLRKSPHTLALLPHPAFALPPLNASPFHKLQPDDTSNDTRMRTEEEAVTAQASINPNNLLEQREQNKLNAINISAISDEIVALRSVAGTKAKSVEDLDNQTKNRAIELGRDILRKLKLHFADMSVENLMKSNPDDVQSLMTNVKKVTDLFRYYLDQLDQKQQELLEHPDVINALKASGTLAATAKLYAIKEAKESGDKELAERLTKEYENMPEEWRNSQTTKVGDLFENLDKGLKVLQYHLLNQTSNLPNNDQLKDLQAEENNIPQQSGMSLAQANAEQTEQMRVQNEMLQQEAYRNMLAERRKANQAAQMVSGAGNTQNQTPTQQQSQQTPQSNQTINASALDTKQTATQQQTNTARRNLNTQSQAQHERRANARPQGQNTGNPNAQRNRQTDTPETGTQASNTQKPSKSTNNFDNILNSNDINSIRTSLNAPTSGALIETNTTKKVIEDKLKEGSQTSTSLISPAPPPPRNITENSNDDPNNKKSYTR